MYKKLSNFFFKQSKIVLFDVTNNTKQRIKQKAGINLLNLVALIRFDNYLLVPDDLHHYLQLIEQLARKKTNFFLFHFFWTKFLLYLRCSTTDKNAEQHRNWKDCQKFKYARQIFLNLNVPFRDHVNEKKDKAKNFSSSTVFESKMNVNNSVLTWYHSTI